MAGTTGITGKQVRDESLTGDDLLDGSVQRKDLDVTTVGQAVVRKIIAGNEIIITETGADSGTGDVTISLNLSNNGYTIFPIWAEEGGGLSNNNRQWSFGNGATGAINIVIPVDAELFAVSFDAENQSGSTTIDIMKNDSVDFTTKAFTLTQDFETYPTPSAYTAGDYLGFQTNTEVGATSDVRVCAWFRIRSSALSTAVLNDLLDVSVTGVTADQVLQFNGSNWVPITLADVAFSGDKADVGLGNVDNTSDADKPVSTAQAIANTADRARANHTGTQLSSTISDFAATVRSTVLTGLSIVNSLVTSTDTVLSAIGKLQGQLNAAVFGRSFNQIFTSGNFTTTSATFVTMQTVPSTLISTGNYVIMFHGRFLKTLISGQVGVRLQVNGTTVMDEEEVSLDDDDFFFGHTMIVYAPGLSGNITVTAQIRQIDGGGNIQVESRTLMYWRVS